MNVTILSRNLSRFCILAVALAANAGGPRLLVAYDEANGGVKSLVLAGDTNGMNWVEGTGTWGTIRSFSPEITWATKDDAFFNPPLLRFLGRVETNGTSVSRYADGKGLLATVTRRVAGGVLEVIMHLSMEKTEG